MIVICTKCQAKFRVADDKIGPRGAKVRCSKCQTVFLVHPVLGTLPVADGDARHDRPSSGCEPTAAHGPALPASAPSRTKGSLQAPLEPPAGESPFAPPSAESPDPFAAAPQADPFAPPAPPPSDPFAGGDPFAPPAAARASAQPGLGDPFVAAVAPRSTLPVTDLSDLLGATVASAPAPVPPPLPVASAPAVEDRRAAAPFAPAPQLDDPFAAPAPTPVPDLALATEPSGPQLDDPFAGGGHVAAAPPPDPFDGDPFAAQDAFAAAEAPPAEEAPGLDLAETAPSPPADEGGLSLEERLTPPPTRDLAPAVVAPRLDVTLESIPAPGAQPEAPAPFSVPPGGSPSDLFDPGAFDLGGDAAESLPGPDLDTRTPAPAPAPPPEPPAPLEVAAPVAHPAAPPPSLTPAPAPAAPDRIPGGRSSRLRTAAVNAVALFALIVVALALWAVWRTDGPFEAASLRPSAILAALGRGGGTAGPWSAQDVRSGVYDRARGAPLLFVRGRVVSRAPAAVPAVRIVVRVVRGAQLLATGEAVAGAVPTAEELYLALDAAAITAATSAARPRAPAEVRPGDVVPFLVAIGDAPPDLEGASLKIEVSPIDPLAAPAPPAAVPAGGGAP
jgi:predicted Zn finger-like uncharacterized protein